jgi:hypothetical protein
VPWSFQSHCQLLDLQWPDGQWPRPMHSDTPASFFLADTVQLESNVLVNYTAMPLILTWLQTTCMVLLIEGWARHIRSHLETHIGGIVSSLAFQAKDAGKRYDFRALAQHEELGGKCVFSCFLNITNIDSRTSDMYISELSN